MLKGPEPSAKASTLLHFECKECGDFYRASWEATFTPSAKEMAKGQRWINEKMAEHRKKHAEAKKEPREASE